MKKNTTLFAGIFMVLAIVCVAFGCTHSSSNGTDSSAGNTVSTGDTGTSGNTDGSGNAGDTSNTDGSGNAGDTSNTDGSGNADDTDNSGTSISISDLVGTWEYTHTAPGLFSSTVFNAVITDKGWTLTGKKGKAEILSISGTYSIGESDITFELANSIIFGTTDYGNTFTGELNNGTLTIKVNAETSFSGVKKTTLD